MKVKQRLMAGFLSVCLTVSSLAPLKAYADDLPADSTAVTEEAETPVVTDVTGTEEETPPAETATPETAEEEQTTEEHETTDEASAETPEPEQATPEQAAEPLRVLTPDSGDVIDAHVGDTVTLTVPLNRDDVVVEYQWQSRRVYNADTSKAVYDYDADGDEPTWYNYVWDDTPEAEMLGIDPDYTWNGIEMYLAIVDALDAIGADSSNVRVAWHTPNYVLEGYDITAAETENGVEVYASNESEVYTAHLNEEGKWEFDDDAQANTAGEWHDIEGATEPEYTFTVDEGSFDTYYQCIVKVVDEAYTEWNNSLLAEDYELTDEQEENGIVLTSVVYRLNNPDAVDQAVGDVPTDLDGLKARMASARATGTVSLSSDNQWLVGVDGNMEYLTQEMYDKVTTWLNNGQIDKATADRYWTQIGGIWGPTYTANELDVNGFPTGGTRGYLGFPLTDGNKLEVNSEWYGKTVYLRYHNSDNDWGDVTYKIAIPAYTNANQSGAAGSKYKDAVVFLNPWVSDAGKMYANFLNHPEVSDNGWLLNPDRTRKNQHITVLSVGVEAFNADPEKYMVDAEGNYRVDSVGWGVCVDKEPDLSGKAYYALKQYISEGYGFVIGHDTMYAYAGAWYDAHVAGYLPENRHYDEDDIDPNDGSTQYYVLNSTPNFDNGHWRMNALMGNNNGNIDSGTIEPHDAVSKIISTGGSHSKYGKAGTMFGGNELRIRYSPFSADLAATTPKYRTPTNFPFSQSIMQAGGSVIPASMTHTNSQVAFGPIWVDYAGNNVAGAEYGYNPYPTTATMKDGSQELTGTSNFYLSGTGNFLMNQIGHLPSNSATVGESMLFSNTVMYISQRKQCEICAAEQGGASDTHFVHRVSSVNVSEVLSALQAGGSYWYPLNGCYELIEDITLPDGWTPIKNFSGHWNSDVYTVTLAQNGQPLFDNTSESSRGKYDSGEASGWNLGNDDEQGHNVVLKKDWAAQESTNQRVTGVARVLGDLNDLFVPAGAEAQDYTGYKVVVHGTDGKDYECTVNTDSKYVISNTPTTGLMAADVYDRDGNPVTQYGEIVVNVPAHFWNDCWTIPLQLLNGIAQVTPIEDYRDYEGETDHIMVGSGMLYKDEVPSDQVVWYYRVGDGDWVKIGTAGTSFTTSDGTVTGKVLPTVFKSADEDVAPNTSSTVQLSLLSYTGNRIQLKTEYTVKGEVYSTESVAYAGSYGYINVDERPMYLIQAFDQRVVVGTDASFTFEANFWKDTQDGLVPTLQYRGTEGQWRNVEGDSLFPDGSYKLTVSSEKATSWEGGVWRPESFYQPAGVTNEDIAGKHITVQLDLYDCEMTWDNLDFRVVFSYRYNDAREKSEETTQANDASISRTGHLTVTPPSVSLSAIRSQALLLNEIDGSNSNINWSSQMSNPNASRPNTSVQLDAFDVGYDRNGSTVVTGSANDNKAVFTTKITFQGNDEHMPTITWLYNDNINNRGLDAYEDLTGAVRIDKSMVGKTIISDLTIISSDKQSGHLAEQEKSFMNIGRPFGKFTGYVTLDALYPADEAAAASGEVCEWYAVTSLHIDNATSPMDAEDVRYRFTCKAELRDYEGWGAERMLPYTRGYATGYTFKQDDSGVYETVPTNAAPGAELILDYNISIRANEPNKNEGITIANGSRRDYNDLINSVAELRDARNAGASIYNYKLLEIVAPHGLRTGETFFIAGAPVNNRPSIDARDGIYIDNSVYDSSGHNFDYYFNVTKTPAINVSGQKSGITFTVKSGVLTSKDVFEWFWRNAVYYICYDAEQADKTSTNVYFYIDEDNIGGNTASFGTNSATNPYSEYTAPATAEYEIVLNGAGGGAANRPTWSNPGGKGGQVTIRAIIPEGTKLYFVAGGAGGNADSNPESGNIAAGGYNGGGNGSIGGAYMDDYDQSYHSNDYKTHTGGGGGATTVAIALAGTGTLVSYGNQDNARNSLLAVAGGGAGSGNSDNGQKRNGGNSEALSGTFALGQNGQNLSGIIAHCSTVDGRCGWSRPQYANIGASMQVAGGGGGGWFGGSADMQIVNAIRGQGVKSDNLSTGGSSWVNGNIGGIVITSSSYSQGGGANAGTGGSATIRMLDIGDARYKRDGKNAFDAAYEDTAALTRHATVRLVVSNKTYDGQPCVVNPVVEWTDGNAEDVKNSISVTYANYTAILSGPPSNASTDANLYPRSASYRAEGKSSLGNYVITWKYENQNPGKTYEVAGLNPSGDGNSVYFDIYPRALTVTGSASREYNGLSLVKVENISLDTQNVVEGQGIGLSNSTGYGYFSEDYGQNSVLDKEPGEKIHAGSYPIRMITKIGLTGNMYNNYYIGTVAIEGSITARPLYLHSYYHDSVRYAQEYICGNKFLGKDLSPNQTVRFDADGDGKAESITVAEYYDGILAGKRQEESTVKYTDNNLVQPNNIRLYDGTTAATVSNIQIDNRVSGDFVDLDKTEYTGSYVDRNSTETLTGYDANGDGGVPLDDRYNKLDNYTNQTDGKGDNANIITLDASGAPQLVNNDSGDYYIADQQYSGAIARVNITAQVRNWRDYYGVGSETPWHNPTAYEYKKAADEGCWLELDSICQGDSLLLDYAKSHFETLEVGDPNMVPDEHTAVGTYPLTYVGLNEFNYDVLKNYIVNVFNGRFEIEPRPIHVTVQDADRFLWCENPLFHAKFELENSDGSLGYIGDDVDAREFLGDTILNDDTIENTIFVSSKDSGGNVTENPITQEIVDSYDMKNDKDVKESKTNIPYITEANYDSPVRYANPDATDEDESFIEDWVCDFCHRSHMPLGAYPVSINTDIDVGNALTIKSVQNPKGETVQNYELVIHDGDLYIHPAHLDVDVPMYVCMWGDNGTGQVVTPSHYGVTNYSNIPIWIQDVNVGSGRSDGALGWNIKKVPDIEVFGTGWLDCETSVYMPQNNTLKQGEMYLRICDMPLAMGSNEVEHGNFNWIVPRGSWPVGRPDALQGTFKKMPVVAYIAGGNVNAEGCAYVTKVVYTVSPYVGQMPDLTKFETYSEGDRSWQDGAWQLNRAD